MLVHHARATLAPPSSGRVDMAWQLPACTAESNTCCHVPAGEGVRKVPPGFERPCRPSDGMFRSRPNRINWL